MSNIVVSMARACSGLGLYHEAKKALEPAFRFLRLVNARQHGATMHYGLILPYRQDKPKIGVKELHAADPMGTLPGDYSTDIVRKVRAAYIQALERIYGKEDTLTKTDTKKSFTDVTEESSPAHVAQVALAAHEADGRSEFNEACRLFTIAHLASKRRNPYFALCRAECHKKAGRMLEAYIDACEAIKLNPAFLSAYECKALALCVMGFRELAIEVFKEAEKADLSYEPDLSILDIETAVSLGLIFRSYHCFLQFRGHKYDAEMIEDPYDPTLAD